MELIYARQAHLPVCCHGNGQLPSNRGYTIYSMAWGGLGLSEILLFGLELIIVGFVNIF